MTENAPSILIVIFSVQLQQTEISERKLFIFHLGVVGIRKMFQDPKRAESSLYILTFLGKTCPDKIKVGYTSAQDKYYPSPLRCGKCCRWGHSTLNCHSGSLCSNCGNKRHNRNECQAELPNCVNCKGTHDATSKNCPRYLSERNNMSNEGRSKDFI